MNQRNKRPRLVIVATHPVQYQVPWFRQLACSDQINLQVVYIRLPNAQQQGIGFDVAFEWDIPLLDGYDWRLPSRVRGDGAIDRFWSSRLVSPTGLLRSLQPDAVVLTGWQAWPLLQVLYACRRLRIPVCARGDSNALKPRPKHIRFLHRRLFHQFTAFLTVGYANKKLYESHAISQSKLFDCPHFIDNARFRSQAERVKRDRLLLRQRWQIAESAVCFCFVGKLVAKKRPLDLLRALARLQAGAPAVHLLVVGSGELLQPARRFVNERRLSVSFTGFLNQAEIVQAYVAADCLVLPSDYGETWGLVVNEAMACGLPAIVSDRVGCGPDLIVPDTTGAVFPFAAVEALAKRLRDYAATPARLPIMGRRAQQRVCERYTVERAVAGTLQALAYLLRR